MRVLLKAGDRIYAFDGEAPDWLDEQSEYRLCLTEERPGADGRLYQALAGGVPLEPVWSSVQGSQVTMEWHWHPEFFAGDFAFAIAYDGHRIWPGSTDAAMARVRTPAYKLTTQDYESMMADLTRWTTGWLAPAPGMRSGRSIAERSDSQIGPLEYLIRHWPALEQLVERLLERPRRVLVRNQARVPLHAANTFGADEWTATLAAPDLWSEHGGALPSGLARLREKAGGLLPGQIAQSKVHSTLDTPENRLTLTVLSHFRHELETVLGTLRGYAAREAPGRMALVTERMATVRTMHRQLSGWVRFTWLAELEPAAGAVTPTTAMLMHPLYGSLWRHYMQWRRAVTLADGGDRSLPVERTHQLYEFWCYLVLVREVAALTGVNPEQAVGNMLDASGAGVRIALQRDSGHTVQLPGVRLAFQRKFRFNSAGPLRSVSYEMRPDITLESAGRLLILDPKYRVGHDGLVDGLGAMHRYRDGIVGAAGDRAVTGAYLLCPAPPATAADEKRYLSEAYQDQWGMGICVLRPGDGTDRLRALVSRFLGVSGATPPGAARS